MTAYDRRTFGRTLALSSALCVLTYGVMLATDGAMTSGSEKLGRLAVLAPLLGALGALMANAQASSRGETQALAALGVSPSRRCLGALGGMALFGLAGAAMLGVGAGDAEGLFPRLERASWALHADGFWVLSEAGVRVSPAGEPTVATASARVADWTAPRGPLTLSVAWMTAVLVDWVRDEIGAWERLVAVCVTGGGAIVLFHWVAAGGVPGWALLVVPAPLLAHAWVRRGGQLLTWKKRQRS